ncbi:MAG: CoA transferase [Deltaproteobacteria bacterium]|nr:CoA transferase [Deltaproteobacteria bacterium]
MSALCGIRVLDLSRLLPGPYCTLLLADLGAEVVKVEAPEGGDPLRHLPPLLGEDSALFHALNRGKRSLALNLKSPQGADVFRRLVSRADVLVEGFRPGTLARLGLGWEVLRQVNPRLVLCSISGYGAQGPLATRAGHDLCYVSRAGVLGYGGQAGGAPPMPGVQVADIGGAQQAALGILAALLERARTGEGRRVQVSLYESSFAFLHMQLGARLVLGDLGLPLARGAEALNGGLACYRLYQTKDGRWLSVAALEPKFWRAFCVALGREDLAGSGWLSGEEGRAVAAEIEALILARTLQEWVRFLADKDLCCEPVLEGDEPLQDLAFPRHLVFSIGDGRTGREVRHLRTPLDPRLAPAAERPPPALGEHSAELLREAGLAAEEIAQLREAGVIR